eukprot:NODE_11955_length_1255_cov_4.581560.p1 GENE.NODE_11955_length_1255_cov_4.581560~~NODE_11955_length_1255_cov_4.581560.p1  ORF type:complete len:130 (-),score=27.59 NODE_11955_length_1255_cov_4.581560:406-795(-)
MKGGGFLVAFLAIHFGACLANLGNFIYRGDYFSCALLVLVVLFSDAICGVAAWSGGCGHCLLPLKDRSLPLACVMMVPYALLQIVIVVLAVEEQQKRRHEHSRHRDDITHGKVRFARLTLHLFHSDLPA